MKNKKFYRRAIEVAWPSVLESFFIALAGIIDTYMVSSIGSSAVAAVGLTTQPKFIALAIFFSINIATSALVARRLGEEDKEGANRILVTAIIMGLVLTVVISALMVYFSDSILRLAGSNSDTHTDALNYFRIIMGGMIFSVVSMTINAAQRGSGNTRIAFTTNLVSSIVNIFFNYCLIGGNFGFPKMEVSGAALATVLGTVVSSIMCIRSLFRKDGFVQIKYIFKKKIKPTVEVFTSIVKLGTNLFVENIAMRIGFLTTALMAAGLGTDTFAAHNVGMNLLSICFAFADGMQVAAVVLTGSSLGAGKKRKRQDLRQSLPTNRTYDISCTIFDIVVIWKRNIPFVLRQTLHHRNRRNHRKIHHSNSPSTNLTNHLRRMFEIGRRCKIHTYLFNHKCNNHKNSSNIHSCICV